MPFAAVCCCPFHSEWGFGDTRGSSIELKSASAVHNSFCKLSANRLQIVNKASDLEYLDISNCMFLDQSTIFHRKNALSRLEYANISACFLLSLVDHEEIGELDISDLVDNHTTVFSSLLTNAEKMKIWNEFVSLSEEEQAAIIARKTTTSTSTKEVDRATTEEENVLTERDTMAIAEKSFNRIERRIRGTLMKKRFPIGGLKHHEEEMILYFSDDPSAIMISHVPSSFDRLVVHGVCQFLDLKSTSLNRDGERIMEIENNQETFCVPSLLLSQYLEQHR